MAWPNWLKRLRLKEQPVPAGPTVTAVIPSEPVVARFRCIKDFWSKSFRSQYTAGGIYSLRVGNDKLAKKIPDWILQGKVEFI